MTDLQKVAHVLQATLWNKIKHTLSYKHGRIYIMWISVVTSCSSVNILTSRVFHARRNRQRNHFFSD